MEFPQRDSRVETRAGADLRQHGGAQASLGRAAERVAHRGGAARSGLPKGVVNFVAGSGGELGQALVDAKPLKAVSFTGSCEIGDWLHGEASKRRLRIQLEMGGKNPTIVLADADFGSAVENVVNAAFFSTGQKCTATSRAIVEDAIYDRSSPRWWSGPRSSKSATACRPGIDIGPCVDKAR